MLLNESKGIAKVFTVHPQGDMIVYIRFHGSLSSCWQKLYTYMHVEAGVHIFWLNGNDENYSIRAFKWSFECLLSYFRTSSS